ncbi:glycosyl transferase family 2 [Clostridiales bacterium COT073_COT-073]|nr:glycosyl transferase family 2 [Clostridiales bacterium COT073_COT-073]
MFCNCLISSSAIKIFSSIFFILIFSLSIFEQRKNSKPFFDLLFRELLCYSLYLIVLLRQTGSLKSDIYVHLYF